MPNHLIDMTGVKKGRLTVIKRVPTPKGKHGTRWLCKCDCGKEVIVLRSGLARNTVSCGCYRSDYAKEHNIKHGMKGTRLYRIWSGIKDRTCNPNSKYWNNYGGRGISICEEWKSFDNFYEWSIQNGYNENLSIDRIDVNGNYFPDNCRWTDCITQCNNRRNTRYCFYEGVKYSAMDLSRKINISRCVCLRKYGI